MKNAVTRACAWLSVALLSYAPLAASQTLEIFAGGGHFVDIPGNTIGLQPGGMAAAPDGFVYVNDINGRLMRINSATGLVTALPATPGGIAYNIGYSYTVAVDFAGRPHVYSQGRLQRIEANGTLTDVGPLSYTGASAFGPDGSLYVSPGDNRVYVQRPSGSTETVAGLEAAGFSGDGGPAALAQLNAPQGVAVAQNGDIYIADTQNHRIRRISAASGVIATFAGTGNTSFNGNGVYRTDANIYAPFGLAFDSGGNLYVSSYSGGSILRIDGVSGLVTRVGGGGNGGDGSPATGASMRPRLITVDGAGNIYYSDWKDQYQKIRRISAATGIVSLAIGYDSFYFCGENVPARQVCLAQPLGLDVDLNGYLVFADPVYRSIRRIAPGTGILSTWKTTTESAIGIEHDAAGNTYVASFGGYQINRYDAVTGAKTVVAGNGGYGSSGDGGPATQATLMAPGDVAIDASGNLYIADGSGRVRKVTAATGIITSLANVASSVVEIDPSGKLIAGGGGCSIYRIDPGTGASTRIAGTGTCGYQDPAGGTAAASTQLPDYMTFAVAPDGNIYLAWRSAQLFKVNVTTGILTRVPAPANGLVTPEGVRIKYATRMEFDAAGNLYISQESAPDQYIFKVSGLLDSTPPSIQPVIDGVAGTAGWYRSDVQVSWVVSDGESAVSSSTGCSNSSVTTDTSGITFSCSATSIGGTATQTVTIKRDSAPPTLSFGAVSPAPDASGWNNGDVAIPFTTNDALSGVYSTSGASPLAITGEGPGLSAQVVVTDLAGNAATFTTPTVNIDRTAPQITSTVSGTLGNADWYTGDVQVAWTVTQGGSPANLTGCSTSNVTLDTAGTTFTCTATSAGGTASKSVTIKRDATPPLLTFNAASPEADDHGWRAPPVSVPFDASDAMSGVATTSSVNPLAITQTGEGKTGQVTVTDAAGNSATFTTPAFNIDGTPPFISMQIIGTKGANTDWYRTDVQIIWGVHDSDSQVLTHDCDNQTVTTDTAGTTFTCSGTSTGGSVTQSVTVKRDATPPTLVWSAPSPAPNAAGWFTSDVEFTYTTGDATSGVSGTSQPVPGPVIVTEDGPGQTSQITVWDNAGNQAIFVTPPVNIDHIPPLVQPFVNGVMGPAVWHTDDVQLHWNVVENNILSSSGCQDRLINTDTAGTTFTCSVTSGAGTTTEFVVIKRDATPPTLTWGAFSPAPNASGWNKTNVTLPFTRADATSGIASTSAASPLTLSAEGAGITGQVTVTDNAGNTKVFTTAPRNIDKTAPVVALAVPANGVTYGFYQDVVADFACTDVSLVSCTGTSNDGELVNTKTAGARTFKVTAKDAVAFTTSVTNNFDVAGAFNFEGFLPNLQSYPTNNLVPKGSLVPIRWRLPDGNGGYVSNTASFSSVAVTTTTCSGATPPLNDPASGPAGISFDPATNAFTYNWQTSTSWTGCRTLTVKFKDGSQRQLVFKLQ